MRARLITNILFATLLAACAPSAPSANSIQTAIAQTQAANPTATPIPPTITASPAPTDTPTLTPTATPDLRVIDVNPKYLVLEKTDLPFEGQYFQPTGWAYGPVTNSEIVSSWTVEEGQAYLARSGRIQGWETMFDRGSSKAVLPDEIWNEAVLYKTADAAGAVIADDADCTRWEGFRPVPLDSPVGDSSVLCVDGGTGDVAYILVFSYRNTLGMF